MVRINCVYGKLECENYCENYPDCANVEGCSEAIDYIGSRQLTCFQHPYTTCETCPFFGDLYNIDGDCLMEK